MTNDEPYMIIHDGPFYKEIYDKDEEAADLIGKEIEMDESDDEDDPRGNNTCPYCGKDADFVDDDEDSTKYYCPHCGEDFLIYDNGTYTTRNGFPIKEKE